MARELLYLTTKLPARIPFILLLLSLAALILFSTFSLFSSSTVLSPPLHRTPLCGGDTAELTRGFWTRDPGYGNHSLPLYDSSCPFHRNAWNCLRNARENMESINSWVWIPRGCRGLPMPRIDPAAFLTAMRGRRIGFVGDSLNENFIVAFLCTLRSADPGARKWKRKGAWRGGYFPAFDLTVAYHRAVLLAKYTWQPVEQLALPIKDGLKGFYKVDVDVPADDWRNITEFYDVLVFNTGHWWGADKFPEATPLIFYKSGKPIVPPLGIIDGLKVVLRNMVSYIDKQVPKNVMKFWRSQSPRHFYAGDWNQNGSCSMTELLKIDELDAWFDPANNGVNKEAREVNIHVGRALQGSDIQLLDITYLSEFRADAHPAIWLGKQGAVDLWGQDCMHWCLPGLPDTWVDILSALILRKFEV